MSRILISDGVVAVDDVVMSVEEFKAIRPLFQLPSSRTVEYTGAQHFQSDGWTQTRGPIPWAAGDALIVERVILKMDLDAYRASVENS